MSTDGISFWDKDDKLIYANKVLRDFQKNVGFDMKVGSRQSSSFKKFS